MLSFILRRILGALPQLLAVSFLVFWLLHIAPGEYCDRYIESDQGSGGVAANVPWQECRRAFGYDLPFLQRYARWLMAVGTGDLGKSYEYHRPVLALLSDRMVNTLTLSGTALILTWGAAILLGVASSRFPHSWLDHVCGVLAYSGLSLPPILLSLLALMFAYTTGWFPIGDVISPSYKSLTPLARVSDRVWHLALPAAVIAFTSMAGYMRQMRSSMIETLAQDYIRTARAKGLSERGVLFKHAFVNAINPLITLFGFSIGFLLSGSFIVETVMNWPGMARLTINAIGSQDEALVLGAVIMATVLLIIGNLVADLLLAAADPRIRLGGR